MGPWTDAARAYENLLKRHAPGGEVAVAKDHIAEAALGAGRKDVALAMFRRVFVEHPAHPLADQAMRRTQELTGKPLAVSPDERIARAAVLTEAREWERALDELALVPT